jgi:hypothetical protein
LKLNTVSRILRIDFFLCEKTHLKIDNLYPKVTGKQ